MKNAYLQYFGTWSNINEDLCKNIQTFDYCMHIIFLPFNSSIVFLYRQAFVDLIVCIFIEVIRVDYETLKMGALKITNPFKKQIILFSVDNAYFFFIIAYKLGIFDFKVGGWVDDVVVAVIILSVLLSSGSGNPK